MKLQRQIYRLITQQASQWHQILEDADDAQRAEFVEWLKQSPLHVKEYLETAYTDQVLNHVDAEMELDVDALLAKIAPDVVPLEESAAIAADSCKHEQRTQWTGWKAALAASIVICAVASTLIFQQFRADAFSTALGEQRTIELADASIVTLNADSLIQVHLDESIRKIELLQGEALFKVAHDTKRPFKVQTRNAVIEAVGTQFNVYERPEGARVSVLEGHVRVHTPQQTQDLSAGEEAQVRLDGSIERIAKADVRNAVAWRERRLVFVNTPLEEMVREFNRYSPALQLRLQDVPPRSHHYNGIFDAADPESLASLLAREPDLILERTSGEIVIRKR